MTLTIPETTRAVTIGALRLLDQMAMACVTEMRLANGRRSDIMAISDKGEIWIVEVKSCRADYESDGKWHEYRPFCDRLFFAVSEEFPKELIPKDTGLIIADQFGGALTRPAPEHKIAGARRKSLTLKIARQAARRTMALQFGDILAIDV
ncbi:MmcB family DNA repair protein [Ponticaulis profundi]|uniref:MmcB family DNA repair protein n=1 Tax=Ponticaulis profundi TaxID=2665222 RepID=A0ABW1SCJ4_9PROT